MFKLFPCLAGEFQLCSFHPTVTFYCMQNFANYYSVDTVHGKIFEGKFKRIIANESNGMETFGESPGRPSVVTEYIAIHINKAKIIVKCAKIFPRTIT